MGGRQKNTSGVFSGHSTPGCRIGLIWGKSGIHSPPRQHSSCVSGRPRRHFLRSLQTTVAEAAAAWQGAVVAICPSSSTGDSQVRLWHRQQTGASDAALVPSVSRDAESRRAFTAAQRSRLQARLLRAANALSRQSDARVPQAKLAGKKARQHTALRARSTAPRRSARAR